MYIHLESTTDASTTTSTSKATTVLETGKIEHYYMIWNFLITPGWFKARCKNNFITYHLEPICKKHEQKCGLQFANPQRTVVLNDYGQCCSGLRCRLQHKLGPGLCGKIGLTNNKIRQNHYDVILYIRFYSFSRLCLRNSISLLLYFV